MNTDDPRSLGLPHATWRPSQKDAYLKALSRLKIGGTMFIEAPVGTGKSGIATALGAHEKVTVLVHNLGLLQQYEREYGFDILMGKQEYPCILESKVDSWRLQYGLVPTYFDCHFSDPEIMCPVAYKCPYIVARNKALISKRMACTYKYAALSESVQNRAGILFMDEVHDSYEEMIGIASFQIDDDTARDFGFPKLPLIDYGPNKDGDLLDKDSKMKVVLWLTQSMLKIANVDLFSQLTPSSSKNKRMFESIQGALRILNSDSPVFYRCSRSYDDMWGFSKSNRIIMQLKSIDIREMVKKIIGNKSLVIGVSATIGNPKPLAKIIGIDQYTYNTYPHPVPVDKRPIYDLNFDKMTKVNLDQKPTLYKQQAKAIAQFIRSLNPEWRGIVLTSSNAKVDILRKFLKEELNGRVHIPEASKLSERIGEFINDDTPGRIAVDTVQGWGTGLSLYGDKARFAVVAGVPYPNPGDRFDAIRMQSQEGKDYMFYRAYSTVAQATGRVMRNEIEPDGSYMLNVAAIADGSAMNPMAPYPAWYKQAIRQWRK